MQQGSSPVGWNQLAISADRELGGFTHIVVYTANAAGDEETPRAVAIVDYKTPEVVVQHLRFHDDDHGQARRSGDVGPAADR